MNGIRAQVATFSSGLVAGPVVAIAAHGLKGFRVAAPDARFSFKDMTPPGSGQDASGYELSIFAETLAQDTQRSKEEILEWVRNGVEFSAEEAVQNGLIDSVGPKAILP